jgi:SAM-dependent methyltransferase
MTATKAVPVDPSNTAQLQAWDGDEGAYWAEHPDYFDRSIGGYHQRLLTAAAITSTDRVLDVGCGTGQTTRDAARAAAQGSALGVDLSARMLDHAARTADAEGVTNASFLQADAQIHPFPASTFDVAISRTAAMFFGDLTAAFANIGRALVPGGRLALVTWQPLPANEWIREISGALAAGRERPAPPPDAPGPFSLSDPDRVRAVLQAGGFTDVELEPVSIGMWFGTDADDAHRFVLGLMGWMLEGLDDTGRARAVEGLRATMAAHETTDGVVFGSGAWLIQATREGSVR